MSQPSRQKTFLFTVILTACALQCMALIGYRLALMKAYVSFSRADLDPPSDLAKQLDWAQSKPEVLRRGEHLVAVMGCRGCHGPSLEGQVVSEREGAWRVVAPNLHDPVLAEPHRRWAALRLGLDKDRRALWAMPRAALLGLAQTDVVALMAYLATQAKEDKTQPRGSFGIASPTVGNRLHLGGYLALLRGELRLTDAAVPAIPTDGWPDLPPKPDEKTYPAYTGGLARCVSCHTSSRPLDLPGRGCVAPQKPHMLQELGQLSRQTTPVGPRDVRWNTWFTRLRNGRCPDGKDLSGRGQPSRFADLSDDEALATLWELGQQLLP